MMQTTEREDQPDEEVIRKMIAPFRSRRFASFPGQVWLKLLTSITPKPVPDLWDLQAPITSLISLQPEFVALMQSIHGMDHLKIIQECQSTIFLEGTNSNVVHLILRRLINTDVALELALISLGRAYLQFVLHQPASVEPQHMQTMITIASQAFNNEYVFFETAEEDEMCKGLIACEEPEDCDAFPFVAKVVAHAMYHPLHSLSLSERQMQILTQHGEYVQELIDRQTKDSAIERNIAANMPSFHQIENEISKRVRQQYEAAPYPRWLDIDFPERREFSAYIKGKFPFLHDVPKVGTLHCLIAGCGTGRHAIYVASKFWDCSVVAIDLSRRSLAYGVHQASRYGISNIEFAHGDILKVSELKRDFDLIEAVGSLHHMEDAVSGIQALTEVLRPGGFMKIAIYRRSYRDRLKPARDFTWNRLRTYTTSELQSIRHDLITQESIDIETAKDARDFYYTSGFRDLLGHVQELSFTPLEIKAMLQKLNLQFLGIDYADVPAIKTAFREAYPDERSSRDLDVYEVFEASHTEQMSSLITFWVRKPLFAATQAGTGQSPVDPVHG